jgi:two-component system chemotaxis sensor kinase CheA
VFDTDVATGGNDDAADDSASGALETAADVAEGDGPATDAEVNEALAHSGTSLPDASRPTDPDDALAAFGRDANVREFVDAFGDSFDGSPTGDRAGNVSEAVTTIPPSVLSEASPADDGNAGRRTDDGSITVDGATADRLLRLTERLTTATMALERDDDGRQDGADESAPGMRELREIATDLEETVTAVRLQPLERAFSGLERTARRVARAEDIRVDLETSGDAIELDREVVATLADPLVHLVRNAVDHGIESPDERAASGKSRTGTVAITAREDGDEAVLEVSDDGRGLEADELRRAAVEEGIVTREQAAAMSDGDAHDLVFHPGLSTESEVTDVSGRGVGMDVVADAVAGLDGDI